MPKSGAADTSAAGAEASDSPTKSADAASSSVSPKGMGRPHASWSDLGRQGGMSPSDLETYNSVARKTMACTLPVLLPLVVINYMDRSAISFTGSAIITNLGISDYEFGLASGVFYIPYCLLQLPSLWIANYVSVQAWLSGLTLLWGVATLLTGTATTIGELVAYRFLLGVVSSRGMGRLHTLLPMCSCLVICWAKGFLIVCVVPG